MKAEQAKKIGGEFEIDWILLKGVSEHFSYNDGIVFSSGRSALLAILRNIAKTNPAIIHVPYYICPSVVKACTYACFKVLFYELDDNFLLPIEYLENIKSRESLLTVNYFGFVNDNKIIEVIKQARPDIITISDQTQSFWTYNKSLADYAFTSLRKHFPVPDGAFVHSKTAFSKEYVGIPVNSFYPLKLLGSILKWQQQDDNIYLNLFAEGEAIIDREYDVTQASKIGQFLFKKLNLEVIKRQRKENMRIIYEIGNEIEFPFIFDYNEEVIPLSVPVLLDGRDFIRRKMMEKNVFLPIHWPIYEFNSRSNIARKMAFKSMSLIVDQRYGVFEMKYQIKILKNLLRR